MNIHKSQLFWCELQGYYWFWHTAKSFDSWHPGIISMQKFAVDVGTKREAGQGSWSMLKHCIRWATWPLAATGGHWRPLAAWTRRSTACASHQLAISWPSQEVQIFCIQLAFGPLGLGKKMTWQTARVQRFHNGNSHDFSGRLTVSPGSDGSGKVSLWQVADRDLSRDRHVHSTFQSNSV